MKNWKEALISPETTILEAMAVINSSLSSSPGLLLPKRIALVVDSHQKLIGVITDGNIRQAILKGLSLDNPAKLVMNKAFASIPPGMSTYEVLQFMKQIGFWQLPVLNKQGIVEGLVLFEELVEFSPKENWVIFMAGGVGTRLAPLTTECPKPLLKVGSKPILQTILENFVKFGFRNFFISVNYKAEMIESEFGDGAKWGVSIKYLRESKQIGTAGALGLLPSRPRNPIIVMNADVLSKVNIQHILDFHETSKAIATMCIRDYHFQIPFGVVKINQQRILRIDEKPSFRFFVNAGIYILEPDSLDFIPQNASLDMPTLFEKFITAGLNTVAFPIKEYWLDIGRLDDFEKANKEFMGVY